MNHMKTQKLLEDKLVELTERAAEIEEKLSDPGEADWAENAVEMEDDEVRIGIGELTKKEIHEVQSALARIESGEYGKCTVCQQTIAPARLEVLPYTMTCIKCA